MTAPRLSGMSPAHGAAYGPRSNAPPQGPRSYFTRGAARMSPTSPVWIAELRALPLPHAPDRVEVSLRIGGTLVVTLNHVPRSRLPDLESLVDCLHLGRVVRLLETKALSLRP